jgi:histidyl-tRNA synthetase
MAGSSIKSVRGTRDLLPPETETWNFVEAAVRDVFRVYNFQEIRTPILEDLQLFQRSVGEETDIVSKEMFAWEDRARAQSEKGQWLALRPENTAGVVRAYIEHKLWERPGLQRFYYIGPQFRRERPQKGRYRQFYQIGAEVIGPTAAGSESPTVDAELLEMLAALLDRLGIQGWSLKLNSVGCANDRPVYLQALRDALKDVVGTMCSDCQRRAETNPLRVLDCKVPEDQPWKFRSPSTTGSSAVWITTLVRPSSSRTAHSARRMPSSAADAMTAFQNRSAAHLRRALVLLLVKIGW